jgi:hypothetical protein
MVQQAIKWKSFMAEGGGTVKKPRFMNVAQCKIVKDVLLKRTARENVLFLMLALLRRASFFDHFLWAIFQSSDAYV